MENKFECLADRRGLGVFKSLGGYINDEFVSDNDSYDSWIALQKIWLLGLRIIYFLKTDFPWSEPKVPPAPAPLVVFISALICALICVNEYPASFGTVRGI